MKNYDVRQIANWYIDKTKDHTECYHGLGSLNNFLLTVKFHSIKKYGISIFKEGLVVENGNLVVDKIVLYYENQAQYLSECIECGDDELDYITTNFLIKVYDLFVKVRPLKLKDIFNGSGTSWLMEMSSIQMSDDDFMIFFNNHEFELFRVSI